MGVTGNTCRRWEVNTEAPNNTASLLKAQWAHWRQIITTTATPGPLVASRRSAAWSSSGGSSTAGSSTAHSTRGCAHLAPRDHHDGVPLPQRLHKGAAGHHPPPQPLHDVSQHRREHADGGDQGDAADPGGQRPAEGGGEWEEAGVDGVEPMGRICSGCTAGAAGGWVSQPQRLWLSTISPPVSDAHRLGPISGSCQVLSPPSSPAGDWQHAEGRPPWHSACAGRTPHQPQPQPSPSPHSRRCTCGRGRGACQRRSPPQRSQTRPGS